MSRTEPCRGIRWAKMLTLKRWQGTEKPWTPELNENEGCEDRSWVGSVDNLHPTRPQQVVRSAAAICAWWRTACKGLQPNQHRPSQRGLAERMEKPHQMVFFILPVRRRSMGCLPNSQIRRNKNNSKELKQSAAKWEKWVTTNWTNASSNQRRAWV